MLLEDREIRGGGRDQEDGQKTAFEHSRAKRAEAGLRWKPRQTRVLKAERNSEGEFRAASGWSAGGHTDRRL
jgi:hypothetical protein